MTARQVHYSRERGPARRPACGATAGPDDVYAYAHLARERFYREIGRPVPREPGKRPRGAEIRRVRAFGDGYVFGSSLAHEAECHPGASQCGPCWNAWGEDRRRWKIATGAKQMGTKKQHSDGPVIGVFTVSKPKTNVDINLHAVIWLERGPGELAVFCLEGGETIQSTDDWKQVMERLYEVLKVDIDRHAVIRLERGPGELAVFCLEGGEPIPPTTDWKYVMECLYEGKTGFRWEATPPLGMFDHCEQD